MPAADAERRHRELRAALGLADRCMTVVNPLTDERCGLAEFHEVHDPLGSTPWPSSPWLNGVHPYDPVPVCAEDEPARFGAWADEENDG